MSASRVATLSGRVKLERIMDELGLQNRDNMVIYDTSACGGRFVSLLGDGKCISMYFHPTRKHSATTKGVRQIRSVAEAGLWACAISQRAPHGNRTMWNDDVD